MAAADTTRKPVLAPPAPPVSVQNGTHPSPASLQSPKFVELCGHVGFDSLPDQLVLKVQQRGFTFNILCVGEIGIGKSTLMESLFNMKLDLTPFNSDLGAVELRSNTYDMEESSVKLKLTIVETAGFGDQFDKEKSAKIIADYIDQQFESFMQEELKIKRHLNLYHDTRIHACIYFISPTGHGLKLLDTTIMKAICSKVNVIPVIAKADTISKDELKRFKEKINSDLKSQGIVCYSFPTDDETTSEINSKLNTAVPFAVVGSTDFVKKNNKSVRARIYPWGTVEVENEEHCDFVQLREALLRTNVEDLRERTHQLLYENYRKQRLIKLGYKEGELGAGLQQSFSQKQQEHQERLKQMEEEMKSKFVRRVKEEEDKLKATELSLKATEDRQQREFESEMRKLEEEERKLNEEIAAFEKHKAVFVASKNPQKPGKR